MYKQILLKEIKDRYKIKDDIWGIIISSLILIVMLSIFVFIFLGLIKGFAIRGLDIELLLLFMTIALILIIFLSLNSNLNILFLNNENDLLPTLPIRKKDIILVRLTLIYLKEILSVILLILPFLISYGLFKNFEFTYYLKVILITLTIPFISLFFQMILYYPYLFYKKCFYKRFIPTIIVLIVLMLGLFLVYNSILEFIIGLVNKNRLQSLFSVENAVLLSNIVKYIIPLKYAGAFLNGNNISGLFYILFIILFGVITIGLGVIYAKNKLILNQEFKSRKKENKNLSINKTLYKKEIIEIYRNKDYMLGYVVVIFSLPIITYLTASVINAFIIKMFGNNFVFVFLLFFVVLFSILSNSFGSTILAKEKSNVTMKVIPVSYKAQIDIKRNLVFFIAIISILITSLVLFFTNILNLIEAVSIFVISGLLTLSTILNSLRKDILKLKNSLNKNTIFNILLGSIIGAIAIFIQIMINKEIVILTVLLEVLVLFLYSYYKYNIAFKKVVF